MRTNPTPVYFISPTAFNLMGLDRWVQNLYYVTYFDSYEGGHPRVFVPSERDAREFNSMEEICNYLLGHKQVIDFIHGHGPTGKACFVMFDERTEAARGRRRPGGHSPDGQAARAARLQDRHHQDR